MFLVAIINISRFWLTLLTDALPLLEHPDKVGFTNLHCIWHLLYIVQIVFSREQTLELMRCMQALEEIKLNVSDVCPYMAAHSIVCYTGKR